MLLGTLKFSNFKQKEKASIPIFSIDSGIVVVVEQPIAIVLSGVIFIALQLFQESKKGLSFSTFISLMLVHPYITDPFISFTLLGIISFSKDVQFLNA